jgi:hypothetical protein
MANDGKVFEQVQAALLNSECSPEYALERALLAVLQFAYVECDLYILDVREKVFQIWTSNDLRDPDLGRPKQ